MTIELKRWWRTVGFRFDAQAAFLMCEQFGVDLSDMDKIPKDEITPAWIWNAHRSHSMQRYKKPLYSYQSMKKFIGLMPKSEWDLILEAMYKSRGPEGDTGEKKKQHGNSSL